MSGPSSSQEPTSDYLATLLELGQLLNSSLDLHQVLETAIEQVIQFVGAERGFILLVDVRNGRVWGEATRNIDKRALEETLSGRDRNNFAEISRTVVSEVLEKRSPLLSHNAMEDPRFSESQSVQLSHLRSVLCVPLMAQGTLLGIIYVDNRVRTGLFTEHQRTMLAAFANQASVAIENARLYDTLRNSLEEKLRLQDELHRQETKRLALEEASRLKSDFIGFVAHELRNPLTTIRGYVQTMLQDEDHTLSEEIKQEFYEAIEADSDRLLDLINELLDVSRLEAGRALSLVIGEVLIAPLLEKLARRHRFYRYFTPQHNLVLALDPNLPQTFTADEDKINQIVANLLSNAIKYSPHGGTVTIGAKTEQESLVLWVSDEGVGLTEEQSARLFRQYERVEREATRHIAGTGLGLYLVKHLVELHHGTITCQSVPNVGSIFTVRLPLQQE
jgi:signal transduction histidine kinase